MEATDGDGDAGDYDKTFLEEPAILDKYKAAADVCESKYSILYHFQHLSYQIETNISN